MVTLSSLKRLSTSGIKEIASVLGGGIYADSLVFIEGEAQTGKSVIAQYITYDAVATLKGEAVYYTTQKTVSGLVIQMKSLSLNVMDHLLIGRLQIYPILTSNNLTDNEKQLQRLIDHIACLPRQFNLVVVDSLTPLIRHNDPKMKLDIFHQCKELCRDERSIILSANPHVIDEQLVPRLFSLTDYHLQCKSEEAVMDPEKPERQIFKILEVAKAHGAERPIAGRVRFEVVPGKGLRIVPYQELKV
jgi:flagellar protein FlaH